MKYHFKALQHREHDLQLRPLQSSQVYMFTKEIES